MAEPAKVNYALAIDSAVVYVALALDKAAGAALSVEELALGYDHPIPADLTRIKMHEVLTDDREAKEWLINRALAYLGDGVEMVDGLVIIANGHRFEDLCFRGKKLERPGPDIHAHLRDPFNPMSGVFSDNIREELKDSKDAAWEELRESLKTFGWVPEFPALLDERGIVLVGNRRMALAKEMGIEPVTQTIHLGKGDAADARRLKIAIVSNIASKRLSPTDRKRIAMHLYSEQNWSMQRIAEALNVAVNTISLDLKEFPIVGNSKRGRPKGKKIFIDKVEDIKDATVEIDEKVFPLIEEGLSQKKIAEVLDMKDYAVRDAGQRYIGVARAKEELSAPIAHQCTCPVCGHTHERRDAQ
jgi:predicted transcriptional regulator